MQATAPSWRLSGDRKGTKATGEAANQYPFSVEARGLVRAHDAGENVVKQATLGPFRLAPRSVHPLEMDFDASPMKQVTFDAARIDTVTP